MSQGCTYISCNKGRTEHSTVRKLIKACSSMLFNGFNNKEYKRYLAGHRCCEIRIHQDPTCSWSCVRCSMSKCVLALSRFGVFGQFKGAFIQPWRFTFVGTQFLAVCPPPPFPPFPPFPPGIALTQKSCIFTQKKSKKCIFKILMLPGTQDAYLYLIILF